jgi:hypothetical protein
MQVIDGRERHITPAVGAAARAPAGAVTAVNGATVEAAAAAGVTGLRAIMMMSLHILMRTTPASLPVHLVDRVTIDTNLHARTIMNIVNTVVGLHDRMLIGRHHTSALDGIDGSTQVRVKTVARTQNRKYSRTQQTKVGA